MLVRAGFAWHPPFLGVRTELPVQDSRFDASASMCSRTGPSSTERRATRGLSENSLILHSEAEKGRVGQAPLALPSAVCCLLGQERSSRISTPSSESPSHAVPGGSIPLSVLPTSGPVGWWDLPPSPGRESELPLPQAICPRTAFSQLRWRAQEFPPLRELEGRGRGVGRECPVINLHGEAELRPGGNCLLTPWELL